jgi:hypothetical protein
MQVPLTTAVLYFLIRFGVDDILNTTELIDSQGNIDYNRISLFSTADYGFTFSYARKLPVPGFQYGVNAKIIRRIIGKFADSGGLDLMSDFSLKRMTGIGLMVRDITTTYNVWNIDEKEYQLQMPYQDKIKNFLKARRSRLQKHN